MLLKYQMEGHKTYTREIKSASSLIIMFSYNGGAYKINTKCKAKLVFIADYHSGENYCVKCGEVTTASYSSYLSGCSNCS